MCCRKLFVGSKQEVPDVQKMRLALKFVAHDLYLRDELKM